MAPHWLMRCPNLDCFFTVIAGHAQATAGRAVSWRRSRISRVGARETGKGFCMRFVDAALAAVVAAALNAAPAQAREVVAFRDGGVAAGTVVVRTHERRLYYVIGDGRAIRYPVGVGRASKQWT